MRGRYAAIWPPFVVASLTLALTAGFGLGTTLFTAAAFGGSAGPWWPAAAQAHGHLQLFGWAGLMVFGVSFHFLPRLRGVPLAAPQLATMALALLLTGLVLRALAQPALASIGPGQAILRAGLLGSGILELAGVSLALAILAHTLRHGPPLGERSGLRPILPLLLVAFAACWLALALNLAGLATALADGGALVAPPLDRLAITLALHGFLVPIAVAMSARLFPLYCGNRPTGGRALAGGG